VTIAPVLRESAISIVSVLRAAGHEAYFAGGCVRDRLLGKIPGDYDIATSARPEQVEALFDRTVAVGRQFGIIVVCLDDADFEVATFRSDGPYRDGRHPESVRCATIHEDAARRDFTINAMFEDPLNDRTIDLVGGRADLEKRLVRAVGDPRSRFGEDRLRMLRAVRFAARFGFQLEPATEAAIREDAQHLDEVSAERIGEETIKMLTEGAARRAFELMDTTGLLEVVLPEMAPLKGCLQSRDYHPEGDVFVHTLTCISHLRKGSTPTLALGVLLHDIAKPPCAKTVGERHTFYGHCELGVELALRICRRLRYSNAWAERVAFLVAQHLRHCAASEMKPATLKRFLRQDGIGELLELARIDALSSNGDLSHYRFCMEKLAELPPRELRPERLVTGHDLIALGHTPGPEFADVLRAIEDAQLAGVISTREDGLALARRLLG